MFRGRSIGAAGTAVGEVVFNTAMTGYQEILTDPSYCRQLVTLTYPHIGNTGVNDEDPESPRVYAEGLIVRDVPRRHSSWRAQADLGAYLRQHNIPGIADIDTRKLTRILRDKGAQNGCLMAGTVDEKDALAQARGFPGLAGMDLAKVVSVREPYEWTEGRWELGKGYRQLENAKTHVVAFDYGIKRNILRLLAERGSRVTVVPANTPAREVRRMKPDGVFLSNGPGDPEAVGYARDNVKGILGQLPLFGICLGHQIMSLALGASTFKLRFGHHGGNHPVRNLATGHVEITSQNHNYAVDADSLPEGATISHLNLNDGDLEGMRADDLHAFSVQYHPEAGPGPHDARYLFGEFIELMRAG
jgi:carbamoyl-phosphate synthase small subunit